MNLVLVCRLASAKRYPTGLHLNVTLVLKADVTAYIDEMNALRAETGSDFFTTRSRLDEEKKANVLIRQEVRYQLNL